MCGIFGIIHQNDQKIGKKELQAAIQLAAHRGPDDSGFWFGDKLAFAHRRLAILDLSEKGHQPMRFKKNVLTYNGEIYNYLEIKNLLKKNGYSFESKTDTEVILAAYDFWGRDCVQHFNGMWAFALYDGEKNRVFCSRDRFGIKPFYYAKIGEKFCFASEIKQFSAIEAWRPKMNRLRAYEFLAIGWHDHTAETFFECVHQLPAGCHLIYDLNEHSFQIEKYYALEEKINPSPTLPFEGAAEKFRQLFYDTVRLRLRSDVKVGTALSGGLDSSSIVGTMCNLLKTNNLKERQESVSACFDNPLFDESPFIDTLVSKTNIRSHKVFPTFEQLFFDLKTITWHQDEPVASASVFAQYRVFKTARQHNLTVLLDGQGADEILSGYAKFYAPFLKNLLKTSPLWAFYELVSYFRLHSQTALEVIAAVRKSSHFPPTDWLQPGFVPSPEKRFPRSVDSDVPACSLNLLQEVGLPILLHYEDRNSMAHSVESRLPFLDYRLVEFCLSLPDNYKIRHGKRKYLLRKALREELPKKVRQRYDKMGFATPQVVWMEENSEQFLQKIKEVGAHSPGIFVSDFIAFSASVLKKRQRSSYPVIWRAVAFGEWVKTFSASST